MKILVYSRQEIDVPNDEYIRKLINIKKPASSNYFDKVYEKACQEIEKVAKIPVARTYEDVEKEEEKPLIYYACANEGKSFDVIIEN